MYTLTNVLSPATQVMERLLERYQTRLRLVEQLGEHTVLARLTDGAVVTATLLADGSEKVWELEDVC